MAVKFTEFSIAGMNRHIPDESKRNWAYASIKFYLERDGENASFKSAANEDGLLYFRKLAYLRILYEVRDHGDLRVVWSVSVS